MKSPMKNAGMIAKNAVRIAADTYNTKRLPGGILPTGIPKTLYENEGPTGIKSLALVGQLQGQRTD